MKKSIKLLFSAALAIVMLGSCSKDDAEEPIGSAEKKVVVTVAYGGDYENYDEIIGAQIVGDQANSTNVDGIEWTETTRPDKLAAQFQRSGTASGALTLNTTKPVSAFTFVAAFVPKTGVEEIEPMTINVQYSIDGELVKTDNFSTDDETESYQGFIGVGDYID